MACWALLAFIKACDLRQNAAIAVKLPKKHDEPPETADDGFEIDQSVFDEKPAAPKGGRGSDIDIPLDDDEGGGRE